MSAPGVNRVAFGRGGTCVHFRSSPKADLNWQPQETPFADPLRLVVILGGDASVSGLQKQRKPLRFKGAITGRFARKGKAIRSAGPPTNLGVRSSNLFGRANKIRNLG
jgi:hypothetical protein